MRTNNLAAIAIVVGLAITASLLADDVASSQADRELEAQISRLVQQLDDDRAAERESAETKLLELAGATAAEIDRFLELLPEENDQMPLGVRDRLTSIREQVEDRVAKAAVINTKITLSAKQMPLAEVFAEIEKQTGNRLADNRQGDAPDAPEMSGSVTIELKDEPFWPAVDQILDQLGLSVYNYGGMDALSLVSRPEYEGKRFGRATYSGPLRFEVLEIQSQRNLRQPERKSLKVQMEVAWEPRLRPIALLQPVEDVVATTDTGATLSVSQPDAVMDVEVPDGTQAAEIILPFELPARDATKLASLKGRLLALVPGRQVKFEFSDLANAAGKSQRRGGVQLTLDDVRKNNAIWEVHMRMALDEANNALESHRGWVFQNKSYLVGAGGEPIENVGLETTRQSRSEVGVAYLFDLPAGIDGLTWVYETPAAIVELPVEYEIKDIELP
ncbi:MAG TPA: hypothetical protein VJ828_05645 [Lacipirellulaceae bacterium]|nr:hypothetical protein [Lacipirellulaceae bacterium]